jgi:UDPglucose 6-dehydrogenase
MRVVVVGAGYVGLVTSACLAELGHEVTAIEIAPERLSRLQRGETPILEAHLDELLPRHTTSGRLRFTDSYDPVCDADVTFIAVNTPAGVFGQTDTRFVRAAFEAIAPRLRPGATLAVKSTVPPGTADAFAERLPDNIVVSNPEFLRQGTAVQDFFAPDRIVIGAQSQSDADALGCLYQSIDTRVFVTSRCSAELAKYAANCFLAMRISFINELSHLCESSGADVDELAQVIGADRRIGPDFLRAGLGWGGSCFPKDLLATIDIARLAGVPHALLDAVYDANVRQRQAAARHIADATRGCQRPVVGVLGLAFKPETDDVRGSPALEVIGCLLEQGFQIRAHDPQAMPNAAAALPNITYCEDAYDTARGADVVLLATEWPEYIELDWQRVRELMRGDTIADGRNALDPRRIAEAGLRYRGFGRASTTLASAIFEEARR